jgi:hypothetical protein
MRAWVRWVAVAVIGASACGKSSETPDSGGQVGTDGPPRIDGVSYDTGDGGVTDTGGADVPLSTGEFPFPGRWWANLPGTATDAGTINAGPFVIHWSETDPTDRALWTQQQIYPLAVSPGLDGSTIVVHNAPGTSGCFAFNRTSDPDALEVRSCNPPPASSAPALGFFRRGPRLVGEIPLPPLVASHFADVRIPYGGIAGNGDWVVFAIDHELWFWKRDTGEAFDMGPGGPDRAMISANGRRVIFWPPPVVQPTPQLLAFDATNGKLMNLAAKLPSAIAESSGPSVLSPDGSKVALHSQLAVQETYDLLLYDFITDKLITVAPHLAAIAYGRQTELFLKSSDHLLYIGQDATGILTEPAPMPMFGYEISTGKRLTLPEAGYLTEIPGDAYAAVPTTQGLMVIDDATFTPRVLGGGGGVVPSPDGAEIAYIDDAGKLIVRNLASGTTAVSVDDNAGCFGAPDPLAPPQSGPKIAVAAIFSPDGALVHEIGYGCGGGGIYGLGRYDRATGTEKIYLQLGDDGRILATSPFGGFVLDAVALPTVVAWPGPPVNLAEVVADQAFSQDATFTFASADRYLIFGSNGYVLVGDNSSAKVTQLAGPGAAKVITNPTNGVTLVSSGNSTLTAYLPDGASWPVATRVTGVSRNPGNTKIAFSDGGTEVFSLEPGGTVTMIGNGYPLVLTDTQIIFRDIDGVCAAPL